MDNNKALLIFVGIGIILYSLVSYLGSKSPFNIFNCSLGVMVILFVFYNEDKKISYLMALFCVNILQWFISVYILVNNPVYKTTDYYYYSIGALFFTLVLINLIRINHLKIKTSMLKDKKKLMIQLIGVIIIISCLTGFIAYYYHLFLYGITLGLMAFIYGFYYENRKVNVSVKYVRDMVSVLVLQVIILCYFGRQISIEDLSYALVFSINIAVLLSIQIYTSDLKISNTKKENIIGIGAIVVFIVFFGALALKGYL
ncbi:hypothetical protein [Methanobacterium sp.]|uniref:hypothetical protein n=1 Tax=Methanobacterium sp. TaxID=2164 RepID=UPI003C72037B